MSSTSLLSPSLGSNCCQPSPQHRQGSIHRGLREGGQSRAGGGLPSLPLMWQCPICWHLRQQCRFLSEFSHKSLLRAVLMAVISITLHKCLCFASEHCKTSPDWTFQEQPPLFFPNALHSICFMSCASHLYFNLPCQAMADFIPSSLHDVFCSALSLLPFPGVAKDANS